jgi:hypothetical protein
MSGRERLALLRRLQRRRALFGPLRSDVDTVAAILVAVARDGILPSNKDDEG